MNQIVTKRQDGSVVAESTNIAIALDRKHKNILKSIRRLMEFNQDDFIETRYRDVNGKMQTSFLVTRRGFIDLTKTIPNIAEERNAILKQYDAPEDDAIDLFSDEAQIEASTALEIATEVAKEAIRQAGNPESQEVPEKSNEETLAYIIGKLEIIEKKLDAVLSRGIQPQVQNPVQSQTTIKVTNELVSVGELAKMLCQAGINTGEMRLFQWMRDNGYLCAFGNEYNLPRQKFIQQGLFIIKMSRVQLPTGQIVEKNTTKVTKKGQEYFINKFLYQSQH